MGLTGRVKFHSKAASTISNVDPRPVITNARSFARHLPRIMILNCLMNIRLYFLCPRLNSRNFHPNKYNALKNYRSIQMNHQLINI